MIIDLPPQLETAISHQAKRHGMATNDYIAQLVKKDLTNNQNPHDIGTMTEFYYDIERMDEALKAPRVEVPKSALKDFATFEKWLDGAFE